tara:strand:- start:91 stop:237 length:147 start_codon:yes stop_codon:yes gene_type:complete
MTKTSDETMVVEYSRRRYRNNIVLSKESNRSKLRIGVKRFLTKRQKGA